MKLSKFIAILALCLLFCQQAKAEIYVIDATKNSVRHNNIGMNYFNEGYYYGAIQEFKIAISLNPNTQASAAYYDNLGKTYLAIGYPDLAQDCFYNAIKYNPMNFTYRQHLADSYRRTGKKALRAKISEYLSSPNPLDAVTVGLMYMELGDYDAGVTKLDEFCITQPNLILTEGVRNFLKNFPR